MPAPPARPVVLLGATGTIGQATARALVASGRQVVCPLRPATVADPRTSQLLPGCDLRPVDLNDPDGLARDAFRGERFEAIISCLASRSGAPMDAWAVDYRAHCHALAAAREAEIRQFVLLSAICVQKPLLAFQQAKLAFERELVASGMQYSIVRATAFFKSLSGQVARVLQGKPFLIFGDGELTACKPISDRDLADYLVGCLDDPVRWQRILPIGGPGPAITPRQQGEWLFELTGQAPRFRQVPVGLIDAIIAGLGLAGRLSPTLAGKAELARIGRYYATESMLLLDPASGRYDADATPSYGSDRLYDHYAQLVRGEAQTELGAHAVF